MERCSIIKTGIRIVSRNRPHGASFAAPLALKGRDATIPCEELRPHWVQYEHRAPFIQPPIETELHKYVGGICNSLECYPVSIGGHVDHVHILCILSKKIALVKLLEELKSHSSKWVKTKGNGFEGFYWQDGYGAFSISPTEVEIVKQYIESQHEHHKKKTFQEEYRAFLVKYKIEFNERYVWDCGCQLYFALSGLALMQFSLIAGLYPALRSYGLQVLKQQEVIT